VVSCPEKYAAPGDRYIVMPVENGLNTRYEKLKEIVRSLGKVAVAFSGGVDSTFLLKVSLDCLGKDNVIAVAAISPSYPEGEKSEALALARSIGSRLIMVDAAEMKNLAYIANNPDRCYHCKTELFAIVRDIIRKEGFTHILEGSNVDDLSDYRPGRKACLEAGARSPLMEARLSKDDIRELSKNLGLPTHKKPAQACLASRIPYGTPITVDRLKRIELSEAYIKALGISQVRVRHEGSTARIEVDPKDLSAVLEYRNEIADKLITLGFTYVSVDLKGYRTGSMNDEIGGGDNGLA
jgi:pyridinium-3,5-biscarboxylic acid mononucleotide sulfurtransferase